jgi:hypothetical protein
VTNDTVPSAVAETATHDQVSIEMARQDYEHFRSDALERVGSAAEFARGALRALTLGNGGAIIALFTFIGNASTEWPLDERNIKWAFGWFLAGLVAVFIATIAAYFGQSFFMRASLEQAWNAQSRLLGTPEKENPEKSYKKGDVAETIGIGGVILSLIFFAVGSGCALQ